MKYKKVIAWSKEDGVLFEKEDGCYAFVFMRKDIEGWVSQVFNKDANVSEYRWFLDGKYKEIDIEPEYLERASAYLNAMPDDYDGATYRGNGMRNRNEHRNQIQ